MEIFNKDAKILEFFSLLLNINKNNKIIAKFI